MLVLFREKWIISWQDTQTKASTSLQSCQPNLAQWKEAIQSGFDDHRIKSKVAKRLMKSSTLVGFCCECIISSAVANRFFAWRSSYGTGLESTAPMSPFSAPLFVISLKLRLVLHGVKLPLLRLLLQSAFKNIPCSLQNKQMQISFQ